MPSAVVFETPGGWRWRIVDPSGATLHEGTLDYTTALDAQRRGDRQLQAMRHPEIEHLDWATAF